MRKKAAKQYDVLLDDNRKTQGDNTPKEQTYQSWLGKVRKDDENYDTYEKKLQKTHKEADQKTTEQWLNDENKRNNIANNTNTLPINELAEDAQRARIKARGDGDGFIKDHFQDYKKESFNLDEKINQLTEINRMIDKLWMAASWGRMTTSERKKISTLQQRRDTILEG